VRYRLTAARTNGVVAEAYRFDAYGRRITRAAEDGVDPITIREVVGWGSPAMERVYTHVSPEHVRGQMGKRTSVAFAANAGRREAPAAEVAAMSTERIEELAVALADELAKRVAGKC